MSKNQFNLVLPFILISGLCIGIIGCNRDVSQDISSGLKNDEKITIDLRNKDNTGNSIQREAVNSSDSEIGYFYGTDEGEIDFGGLTEEDLRALISFADDENGVKVTYKAPEKYKNNYFMTRMIYIDGNGHWSTRETPNYDKLNARVYNSETGNFEKISEYSWVYPLVLPGKTYKFSIQFQYTGGPDFQLYYLVTPKHGLGIIDDLPKGWVSSDYSKLEDSVFSLIDVIPVETKGVVKKSIGLWANDIKEYWGTSTFVGCYDEDIENEESATFVDLKKMNYFTDKKYVFCQFMYKYYLEGFDDCDFQTPDILTPFTENTYFSIPIEDRE